MYSTRLIGHERADLTNAHRLEKGAGFWCFISTLIEQVTALNSVVCLCVSGERVKCM